MVEDYLQGYHVLYGHLHLQEIVLGSAIMASLAPYNKNLPSALDINNLPSAVGMSGTSLGEISMCEHGILPQQRPCIEQTTTYTCTQV